ncbi:MAG: WecB/TagA/CpsF family glycosyltransferase [bacterium]|nr:WecB/TagA/CpsF family glycosyltransferase [bacterium]
MKSASVKILGTRVNILTYETFLHLIKELIQKNDKAAIAYANADTLNKIYESPELQQIYENFTLVHPDGTGVYLASKFLHGKRGLKKRITGSDFYPLLIEESIKNDWKYFFFGHDDETLQYIRSAYPMLNVKGTNEGYHYINEDVISKINKIEPDIIIIGLSCPFQEKWIYENIDRIKFKVILAVGDGIKVFAKRKLRGPLLMRRLGLEWTVRLFYDPVKNFRKYVIGIPKFVFRVIRNR